MPAGWDELETELSQSASADIHSEARALAVTFGSARAMTATRQIVMDQHTDLPTRQAALDSLLGAHDPKLAPKLLALLKDPSMRGRAIRGLAAYDDLGTSRALLDMYASISPAEKKDALTTLASRASFAGDLLAAVEHGMISSKDISADLVRQLRNLHNADIDQQVAKVWGVLRDSPQDKLKRIAELKAIATAVAKRADDPSHGRLLFTQTCAQCHTLFDAGGKVGPDITGSNRADLNYILENIVDPNAVIPNDYRASVIDMKDGRTIIGIVKQQNDQSITVVTTNETLALPRGEIEKLKPSPLSMMPEGIVDKFSNSEIRDLLAYLRSPAQVPLAATDENAKALFNGKDLTGWNGLQGLWSVENGEIVGKTEKGIKQNEFLKSQLSAGDFRLVLKIKLVPDTANSGVQFRSVPIEGTTEMRGCQADAGAGWWGKLYEESGRGILSGKGGEQWVHKNDWNTYEILAVGGKIRTALNGHLCVDIDDPKVATSGIFGLQVHAGGPTEVRFKDIELESNPKFEMKTVKE
jgi:putative heme-binding domain-containing protein